MGPIILGLPEGELEGRGGVWGKEGGKEEKEEGLS